MAYSYTAPIVVDNTKVSGSSDLTNFPVLFAGTYAGSGDDPDLRTTGNGGKIQNTFSNGGASGSVTGPADLIFTSDEAGTSPLDHEIVYYNASTGQIVAWVEIPTLLYNSDTTIYLQYGDASVTTSQEDVAGTWNSSYVGVWHLAEASGTRYDSTGNSNDLTDNNTVGQADGKIFKGADFELSNSESLTITDASQTGLDFSGGDYSYVFWAAVEQLPSTLGSEMIPISKNQTSSGNFGYRIRFLTGDTFRTIYSNDASDGSPAAWSTSDAAVFTGGDEGTFFHFAQTTDVSAQGKVLYKNGAVIASTPGTFGGTPTSLADSGASFALGGNNNGTDEFFDGKLEEVRAYIGILNADWIATEYNNQNSPSTFYSITADEGSGGGGSSFTPRNNTVI